MSEQGDELIEELRAIMSRLDDEGTHYSLQEDVAKRHVQAALAEIDELRERCEPIANNSTEMFEMQAAVFRCMTGHWPPGKDWPAARGPRDEEGNRKAWDEWCEIHAATVKRTVEVYELRRRT